MKKFLLAFVAVLTMVTVSAQETKVAKWETELSGSYNFSNTQYDTFKESSLFNIQLDARKDVIGAYVGVGRGVDGAFGSDDQLRDYFAKAGATLNGNIGYVRIYLLAGVGTYLKSDAVFVEYGGGIALPLSETISVGCKVSNFDKVLYVSPTLSIKL